MIRLLICINKALANLTNKINAKKILEFLSKTFIKLGRSNSQINCGLYQQS